MIISAAFCSIAKEKPTKKLMIIFVFNIVRLFCPFDVKQLPKIMIFLWSYLRRFVLILSLPHQSYE